MENQDKKLEFFETIAEKYIELHLHKVDFPLMKNDEGYAKKIFFYKWAFERNNAPHGYKVAAIKALEKKAKNTKQKQLSDYFDSYYYAKKNEKNNPFYDPRIENLNIKQCIEYINKKEFSNAFEDIAINGVSHKIRSFFIRDMVYFLKIEESSQFSIEEYLYMFPTDIWVQKIGEFMGLNKADCKKYKCKTYRLNPKFRIEVAASIIEACIKTGVSPVLVNMGMWYYASHYVADSGRLKKLIENGTVDDLKHEMKMVEDFCDI